jgi:hypothetical protein
MSIFSTISAAVTQTKWTAYKATYDSANQSTYFTANLPAISSTFFSSNFTTI